MNGLIPLLGKEIKEQVKTYRFLIVAAIFVMFGISSPLILKYMPEIMKLAGEGMSITIPPPTTAQALGEYIGNIGQLGLLIAVLMAMGGIANEIRHGTAIIPLSKPISRTAFVTAKLTALSMTFVVSLGIASAICFGYSVWLIGPSNAGAFLGVNLLVALFLVFCLAFTLLLSSAFKSSLAAGGLALGALIAQSALGMVPVVGDFTPGKLLSWSSNLLTAQSATYWGALILTLVAIVACLGGTRMLVSRKEI
jgi:ABC-2 type transport system permease protein